MHKSRGIYSPYFIKDHTDPNLSHYFQHHRNIHQGHQHRAVGDHLLERRSSPPKFCINPMPMASRPYWRTPTQCSPRSIPWWPMPARTYNADAGIKGVLIQQMAQPSREVILILCANRYTVFDPLIMFGFGGIFVEELRMLPSAANRSVMW